MSDSSKDWGPTTLLLFVAMFSITSVLVRRATNNTDRAELPVTLPNLVVGLSTMLDSSAALIWAWLFLLSSASRCGEHNAGFTPLMHTALNRYPTLPGEA